MIGPHGRPWPAWSPVHQPGSESTVQSAHPPGSCTGNQTTCHSPRMNFATDVHLAFSLNTWFFSILSNSWCSSGLSLPSTQNYVCPIFFSTLPETSIAHENQFLENEIFFSGPAYFQERLLVSRRVYIHGNSKKQMLAAITMCVFSGSSGYLSFRECAFPSHPRFFLRWFFCDPFPETSDKCLMAKKRHPQFWRWNRHFFTKKSTLTPRKSQAKELGPVDTN